MARRKRVTLVNYTTDADQSRCLLFKLPAEIRNRIYEITSLATTMMWVQSDKQQDRQKRYGVDEVGWDSRGRPKGPGMLLACKQMLKEAIPIFYSRAAFKLGTRCAELHWIRWINDADLKAVQFLRPTHNLSRIKRELADRTLDAFKKPQLKTKKESAERTSLVIYSADSGNRY